MNAISIYTYIYIYILEYETLINVTHETREKIIELD